MRTNPPSCDLRLLAASCTSISTQSFALLARRKIRTRAGVMNAKPVLLSFPEEIGVGFLAGVASRAITTPLSIVTVRLQTSSEDDEDEDGEESDEDKLNSTADGPMPSPIQVMRSIYTEEGVKGLWRGQ